MTNGWKLRGALCALALALALAPARAQELGALKVGVLKFGTVSWELDVIRHHGLDAAEGFTLEVQEFGGNEAADVALQGKAVDAIVEDWLWVSRQRADGQPLVFAVPYSSTVGALMVPLDAGIGSLEDLSGKRLGIAGGPLDKSWLLLRGLASEQGLDLAAAVEEVYGAPPLLQEKTLSGELDALINYWHYAARLEAQGFERLLGVGDAMEQLGVAADVPQLGYVMWEAWADENPELVQAFSRASRAAKQLMLDSDEEWERLRELTRAEDDATLEALRERYREGVTPQWGEEQQAEAAELYAILAKLGGEQLVGQARELAPGTFWAGVTY